MTKGWICLHRDSLNHWTYQDSDYWKIWTTMLMKANHGNRSTLFNGSLVTVERGQFVFGRDKFSAEVNVSISKVRRCLKLLKNDQMIDQQNKNKYSIISILNYSQYQDIDQQSSQQTTSKPPANDQQTTTSKQLNNENNGTNKNKTPSASSKFNFDSWPEIPSEQTLKDWMAMRRGKKAPISQTVINRYAKQLELAVAAGYSVEECLSLSTTKGWLDFKFDWLLNEERENGKNSQSGNGYQSKSDRADEAAQGVLSKLSTL